jgi:hypothetical protein
VIQLTLNVENTAMCLWKFMFAERQSSGKIYHLIKHNRLAQNEYFKMQLKLGMEFLR